MLKTIRTLEVCALLALLVIPAAVLAHKVNAFATIEDGRLVIEGYFPDGKKARNSRIAVFDSNNKLIAQGSTDEQGRFSTEVKASGEIRVVLDAGMGHRTQTTTLVSGHGNKHGNNRAANTQANTGHEHGVHEHGNSSAPHGNETTAVINQNELENAVRNAIAPLERKIVQFEQKTHAREIIGGLGYIFGIFGVIMYFQARQKSPKPQTREPEKETETETGVA